MSVVQFGALFWLSTNRT